eukprot:Gb_01675 [translate_table: standard]
MVKPSLHLVIQLSLGYLSSLSIKEAQRLLILTHNGPPSISDPLRVYNASLTSSADERVRGSREICTWIRQADSQMLTSGSTHQLSNKSHSLSLKQQQQLSPSALSWNSNVGQIARRSFMEVVTKAVETQKIKAGVSWSFI